MFNRSFEWQQVLHFYIIKKVFLWKIFSKFWVWICRHRSRLFFSGVWPASLTSSSEFPERSLEEELDFWSSTLKNWRTKTLEKSQRNIFSSLEPNGAFIFDLVLQQRINYKLLIAASVCVFAALSFLQCIGYEKQICTRKAQIYNI